MDPDPTSLRRLQLPLALTLILGALLFWIDQFLQTSTSPLGIISFELAKNPFKAELILAGWGSEGHRWAVWSLLLDFPFLAAYTLLFTSLTGRTRSDLKQLFSVGFLIAGMCDAVENLALAGMLAGYFYPQLTSAAYYFASLKFLLLFSGWAFLLTHACFWFWTRLQPAQQQVQRTAK